MPTIDEKVRRLTSQVGRRSLLGNPAAPSVILQLAGITIQSEKSAIQSLFSEGRFSLH